MSPQSTIAGHWTCRDCGSTDVAYVPDHGVRACRACGREVACRVFLSHARDDDEPFVDRLYEDLTARGFQVWWDRRDMPARERTFLAEIGDAIAAQDRLLLVVGPRAATSDYVVKEWRWAWDMERPVKCVLRLGDATLVPEELRIIDYTDCRDDRDYEKALATLVRELAEPPALLAAVHGVPSLPAHLIVQPDRLRALKGAVLVDLSKPVVVTGAAARSGIHGMAGIGKSVLANMPARSMLAKAHLSDWSADPRLCSDCPNCGSPLQFNPVVVEIEDPERQVRREVDACIALLGPTHRNTLSTRLGLAAMLEHLGREAEARAAYADLAQTCAELADEQLSAANEVVATLILRAGERLDPVVVQALNNRIEAMRSLSSGSGDPVDSDNLIGDPGPRNGRRPWMPTRTETPNARKRRFASLSLPAFRVPVRAATWRACVS